MSKVDNLNGERLETETASVAQLIEARDEINHHYPAGGHPPEGLSYQAMMREQVEEIEEELQWRRDHPEDYREEQE